jgi:hypothetical protein
MALFGGMRDAKFLASINSELINAIIDTEIEFFKLNVTQNESNIYGESERKAYFDSVLIPCVITKDEKNSSMDEYGHTYTRTAKFALSRDLLERVGLYPSAGDIILWDNEYFEIDNVDANQYFAGKNPETWPNGDSHGYSVSIICDTHATRQTPAGIKDIRRGGDNKIPLNKGR